MKTQLSSKISLAFTSSITYKLASMLMSLWVINQTPNKAYGAFTLIFTTLAFFMPFTGGGLANIILRLGKFKEGDLSVLHAFLKYALYFSLILSLLVLFGFLIWDSPLLMGYHHLLLLILILCTHTLYDVLKNYLKSVGNVKLISSMDFINAFCLVLITALGFGSINSFLMALILSPFLAFSYAYWKVKKNNSNSLKAQHKYLIDKKHWKAGLSFALAGYLSQFIYYSDHLMLAEMVQNQEVQALYKVAGFLPLSLMIIPVSFFNVFFSGMLEVRNDLKKLYTLITRYLVVMILVIGLVWIGFYFLGPWLLKLLFPSYAGEELLLLSFYMLIGVTGAILLRFLFGQLMNVYGWAKLMLVSSLLTLLFNILGNLYFINLEGAIGAAKSTALALWFSGILPGVIIYFKLKAKKKHA